MTSPEMTDRQYYERKRDEWHDARHERSHQGHGPWPYNLDIWARRSADFGWRGAIRFPTACGDIILRAELPPGGLRCLAQDPLRALTAAPSQPVSAVSGYQIVGAAAPEVGILPLIAALAPTVLPMLGQALGGAIAQRGNQPAAGGETAAPAGGGGGGGGGGLGGMLGGLLGGGGGGGGGMMGGLTNMISSIMPGGGGSQPGLGGLMGSMMPPGMPPMLGGMPGFPPMPHQMLGLPFPPMPHEMMMRAAGMGLPAAPPAPAAPDPRDARIAALEQQMHDRERDSGRGRRRSWEDDYDERPPAVPWRRIRDYIDNLVDNRADVVGLLRRGPGTLGAGALLAQADGLASSWPAVAPDVARLIRTSMRTVNAEGARMLGNPEAAAALGRATASAENKVARALHAAEALIGGP